ncbi:MAG: hypothetical protein JNK23_01725 [Opitutaceae bacterium]|nr:hypothetical protein [Opitutaceae bacterium]
MVATLYTLLGLVALGSVVTVYAALTAKEGYEDADGFHPVAPEAQTSGQTLTAAAPLRH